MAKVTFLPDNKECNSPSNVTFLEVAKRNNIPHVAACGGEGNCTTCRLLILDGIDINIQNRKDVQIEKYSENETFEQSSTKSNEFLVTFLNEPKGYFSNRWLTCLIIDEKKCGISVNQIISEFEEEKIETRRLWKPMHMQPIFKNNQFYGNGVSNLLFEFLS